MKPAVEIKILPASCEEAPIFVNFLQKYFFPEEPLNSALKRFPPPEEAPSVDTLKEGLSLKAVNLLEKSEDNLVGLIINKESSAAKKRNIKEIEDPKKIKIFKIINELDEKSKIWDVVNNENHFGIQCIAVSNKYRGHRIGRKLIEESLKLAKSLNHKYVSIECSSFYSAKIVLDLGFELLAEIPYDEYLDENNDQVFKVNPPHKALKKLIRRL